MQGKGLSLSMQVTGAMQMLIVNCLILERIWVINSFNLIPFRVQKEFNKMSLLKLLSSSFILSLSFPYMNESVNHFRVQQMNSLVKVRVYVLHIELF